MAHIFHPISRFRTTAFVGLLAATAWMAGCEPVREPVEMTCTGSQHCPATGVWTCDLALGMCVPCEGACPGTVDPDVASNADTSATVDAGITVDTGITVDAGATDTTTTGALYTCNDRCGEYVVDENGCSCDDQCTELEDCCDDFVALCPDLAPKDSDTSGADGAMTDAGATDTSLPSDVTST